MRRETSAAGMRGGYQNTPAASETVTPPALKVKPRSTMRADEAALLVEDLQGEACARRKRWPQCPECLRMAEAFETVAAELAARPAVAKALRRFRGQRLGARLLSQGEKIEGAVRQVARLCEVSRTTVRRWLCDRQQRPFRRLATDMTPLQDGAGGANREDDELGDARRGRAQAPRGARDAGASARP